MKTTGCLLLVCFVLSMMAVDKYLIRTTALDCLASSQEVVKIQSYRLVKLEHVLMDANSLIGNMREDAKRREKLFEEMSQLLAELAKDNADLQTEIDNLNPLLKEKTKQLLKTQEQLATVQKKLDDLTKKMANQIETNPFNKLMETLNEILN